jgi:hypothetical protein
MSSRSRQANKLARGLEACWGLGPGAVQVVWDQDWRAGRWRWGYRVEWADGPTVGRMRLAARTAVSGGPGIDELVARDLVRFQRSLSPLAWAVKLAGRLRDGGPVPDLAQPAVAERWQAELEAREFPERARTPAEQTLARRLVEHARSAYAKAVAERDRTLALGERPPAVPPLVELLGRTAAAWRLEDIELLPGPQGRALE